LAEKIQIERTEILEEIIEKKLILSIFGNKRSSAIKLFY